MLRSAGACLQDAVLHQVGAEPAEGEADKGGGAAQHQKVDQRPLLQVQTCTRAMQSHELKRTLSDSLGHGTSRNGHGPDSQCHYPLLLVDSARQFEKSKGRDCYATRSLQCRKSATLPQSDALCVSPSLVAAWHVTRAYMGDATRALHAASTWHAAQRLGPSRISRLRTSSLTWTVLATPASIRRRLIRSSSAAEHAQC